MKPIGKTLAVLGLLLLAARVQAEDQEEAVARQSENPLSRAVLVPIQNVTSFRLGPFDRTANQLLLQPAVPFPLTSGFDLIALARIPFVWAPAVASPSGLTWGVADINLNLYVNGFAKGFIHWGLGPAIRFPTGTSLALGQFTSRSYSLGPAGALVLTPGHWVVGALVSNVWSVIELSDAKPVNQLLTQVLLNYNLPGGWYLTSSPLLAADWEAPGGNEWLVPVGGGLGYARLLRLRQRLAISFEAQAFTHVVRPEFGPTWSLRFQVEVAYVKLPPPLPPPDDPG